MTDYDIRQLKDRLHSTRIHRDWLMIALNAVRHETIARGARESEFAFMCDLTLAQLHELIGTHAEYVQRLETNTKETA